MQDTIERTAEQAAKAFKLKGWFDFQKDAFKGWLCQKDDRALVFYPTGKGKSKTMLAMLWLKGYDECVVIAPPITHAKWKADAAALGMTVHVMSHALFRMPTTKLSRTVPVICDEFHMLGGHRGKGWVKFDRMTGILKAPVIIGSATPQYNDAERVYCILHALRPYEHKGGYIHWLYEHCHTSANPFSPTPDVIGFREYENAEEYLASLDYCYYLPDEAPDIMVDVPVQYDELPDEFYTYGVDRGRQRIMASMMERRQRESLLKVLTPEERLTEDVATALGMLDGDGIFPKPVLVFANRSTVAKAIRQEMSQHTYDSEPDRTPEDRWYWSHGYIDGSMTTKQKDAVFQRFLAGEFRMLIGTASLATGADGIDKMCDHLIIVDDTDDDALRRQLVGRVLPRGELDGDDPYADKRAYRFVYTND